MKLIVDAQLPAKLCEILNQLGLESIHVDELPKGDETSDMVFFVGLDLMVSYLFSSNLRSWRSKYISTNHR